VSTPTVQIKLQNAEYPPHQLKTFNSYSYPCLLGNSNTLLEANYSVGQRAQRIKICDKYYHSYDLHLTIDNRHYITIDVTLLTVIKQQ